MTHPLFVCICDQFGGISNEKGEGETKSKRERGRERKVRVEGEVKVASEWWGETRLSTSPATLGAVFPSRVDIFYFYSFFISCFLLHHPHSSWHLVPTFMFLCCSILFLLLFLFFRFLFTLSLFLCLSVLCDVSRAPLAAMYKMYLETNRNNRMRTKRNKRGREEDTHL